MSSFTHSHENNHNSVLPELRQINFSAPVREEDIPVKNTAPQQLFTMEELQARKKKQQ